MKYRSPKEIMNFMELEEAMKILGNIIEENKKDFEILNSKIGCIIEEQYNKCFERILNLSQYYLENMRKMQESISYLIDIGNNTFNYNQKLESLIEKILNDTENILQGK